MSELLGRLNAIKDLKVEEAGAWPFFSKLVVYLLLVVFGFWLVFFVLVKPNVERIDRVVGDTQKIEQEIDYKLTKLSDFDQEQDLLEELSLKLAKANLVLPEEQEQPELIDKIAENALRAKLQLDEFRPLPEIETEQFFELPIQLVFEGDYHSVGIFMASVSSMERLVIPTRVELVKLASEKKPGLLSGKLLLRTYRFKDGLGDLPAEKNN